MSDASVEKIKIKNIYYMLSYAYQTLHEKGIDSVSPEEFDNIHDLLAAILVQGVGTQIKRGLHRDYIEREEALAGLRGQVRVSETLRLRGHVQGKLVCCFDDFSVDSPHNQAIKSVMHMLLRHAHVRPENKDGLRKLLLYFADVTEIAPTAIRWDALSYHRNTASYVMRIGVCRLVVEGLLLSTEKGTHKLSSWLQDEAMYTLYERFVLAYYQRHHPEFSPQARLIDWDIADGADLSYLPKMKTDITMQYGDRKLIIDTKYYSKTMQSSHDRQTFISGHLYQIFAYVKNSDRENTGNVAGVLLYAKTDEKITPNADNTFGGNRISLKTLDLNQDWEKIKDQLESLCAWLLPSGAKAPLDMSSET
jgi:5-methylcytosine-specific restriction enzyme subunit McrC